jgi:4-hydroxy-tetrahydrodipicolinate reductase
MGQTIIDLSKDDPKIDIVAQCDLGDAIDPAIKDCDVAIDFSHAGATEEICRAALQHRRALVIGTTGHSTEQRQFIEKTAGSLPIVFASNFSVGVNVLFALTRRAAEILGSEFAPQIVETHHKMKKDAPSGTAKKLAEILCEVRKLDYAKNVRHGREGLIGERPAKEIGLHSIRGGDVVGDHTVTFAGAGERLELVHKAASRETFAAGALRAASWIVGRPAGLYSMEDVLGL